MSESDWVIVIVIYLFCAAFAMGLGFWAAGGRR